MMWEESRPVLLGALERLLRDITPDEFQELSRQQMWNIVTRLYFPDGHLQYVIKPPSVRCGGYRHLD